MKIAVYTICKDESKFVDRWLESCIDADHVLVVDTGSTDDTVTKLTEKAAEEKNFDFYSTTIVPWRFDDARNLSLHLLPADIDICICLDMDEILVEGWRDIIEREWEIGIDRLRYDYVWSWVNEKPGVTYHADKIHTRHGFRWVNPVHEVLQKDLRNGEEKQKFIKDTLIEHYPDNKKSRSSYLELLALAVKENPNCDRNAHYYARDLYFCGSYKKAINEFKRHLALPSATWKSERAASMRYMGDCYWALGDTENAILWFNAANQEAPHEREPLVALAQAYRALKNWDLVIKYCKATLQITSKPNTYINQPNAWSEWPNQMLEEAKAKKTKKGKVS